jgi:hypothetical protein
MASLLRQEEREWIGSNDLRRRLRYSWFSRELLSGGEHPIRYAFSLLALTMLSVVFVNVIPKGWFMNYAALWDKSEQLAYFTTLWSIQATIVALVYPIVISFVSLLLQRQPSSKAFLQIYLVDSGGLVSGISSMFLVLMMSVQYFMFSSYTLKQVVTWVGIDTLWFTYNTALTIRFLFRTVEFLRPDI